MDESSTVLGEGFAARRDVSAELPAMWGMWSPSFSSVEKMHGLEVRGTSGAPLTSGKGGNRRGCKGLVTLQTHEKDLRRSKNGMSVEQERLTPNCDLNGFRCTSAAAHDFMDRGTRRIVPVEENRTAVQRATRTEDEKHSSIHVTVGLHHFFFHTSPLNR